MNPMGLTGKYIVPSRTIKISTGKKKLESDLPPALGRETSTAVARSKRLV